MARAGVAESRRLLREVLVDRIVFRPVPRPPELPPVKGPGRRARLVYEFTGEASLSKLFRDLIYVSPMVGPDGTRSNLHNSSTRFHCTLIIRSLAPFGRVPSQHWFLASM
jgi:hypothetical protein